ncbi:unnamed protein product [Adineta ricciae]|uniref:beta-glucosidase n=1 Tax=Adineta ricciae TaxID=249248 RepID=A0A814XEU1_ADIRI|nr:unnamed protein product [Adineta ricciae]CAF1231978.1 unnamed protein product [Adineta ricciae]
MKIILFVLVLLQISISSARTNKCELISNDNIQLTENKLTQSRKLCNPSEFPMNNIRQISITGRLVDYTTNCQKSINNATIEIIYVHLNRRYKCSKLHYPNVYGSFNSSNLKIHSDEEIFIRITAPGYEIVDKKIEIPLSYQQFNEINFYWQIGLTTAKIQTESTQNQRMKSIVDDLLAEMTLGEKIGQLNLEGFSFNDDGPIITDDQRRKISRGEIGAVLNIFTPKAIRPLQELAINSSRLKVPFMFGLDVIHGYKTIFPVPLAMSSTWNITLIQQSARIAVREATADAINWVFSPMVDIAHDPRWGRIMEGSGEDPWLGSQVAAAMVRGYQGGNLSDVDTVMACFKHFGLYGAAEGGRDYNTVDMSPIGMYEFYLPPYRAAVEAGAESVMTSFNDINGIPSTANQWLLNDLLRQQWNFTGFVVTDAGSIGELIRHGLGDLQEVSAHLPRTNVPASGSERNLPEIPLFRGYSGWFQLAPKGSNRKTKESGSGIPIEISRTVLVNSSCFPTGTYWKIVRSEWKSPKISGSESCFHEMTGIFWFRPEPAQIFRPGILQHRKISILLNK